jgi:formate dehydrogenase maturation protein FdhE
MADFMSDEPRHDYAPIGDPQAMRIIELERQLENQRAHWEQKLGNEWARELRQQGFCPVCGSEA